MVLLAALVALALAVWGLLVLVAVDVGRSARSGSSGNSGAWTVLVLASLGATACLFVGMVLALRLVALVRGRDLPSPRRPRVKGGHRAAR